MRLTRSKVIALVVGVIAVAYAVTATGTEHDDRIDRELEATVEHENGMARRARLETEMRDVNRSSSAPASLAGTDPDGDLAVTVSRATIRLFDYYLTSLGETDLAGVRALVAAEVQRQSPPSATEVLALFDRYIRYLEDVRGVHASTLDSYFAQTLALQRHHFGDAAEALFGADNALAARLLAQYGMVASTP